MVAPEIVEGVIIEGDPAAQPLVGVALDAEAGQLAAAANALDGGVEPQGDQQLGIGGGASGPRAARADGLEEEGQVPAQDQRPDGSHRVVVRDQIIDRAGSKYELLAVGTAAAQRRIQVGGRLR
jgi:hypothetical protein